MKIIKTSDPTYKEALDLHNLLDLPKTRKVGIPIFNKKGMALLPLRYSCQNPNGYIYDLIKKILLLNNSSRYYILPIDYELELVQRVRRGTLSTDSSYIQSSNQEDCCIIEVYRDDIKESIIEFLNDDNCYAIFQSFLVTDRSRQWCIIDMDSLPFSLLFCDSQLSLNIMSVVGLSSDIIVSKNELKIEMKEYGLEDIYKEYVILYK